MLDSKDVPVPLTEQIDKFIQNPTAVLSVIGALFLVAIVASTVSHLGSSSTHDRPQ